MKVLTKELYYRLQIIIEITCNTSDKEIILLVTNYIKILLFHVVFLINKITCYKVYCDYK